MPYAQNTDLPKSVKDHLPAHAQDIFREAFNHAFQEYHNDEERTFRVAWSAVGRNYEKGEDGDWHRKSDS